jgi:hypothetical protein
MRISVQSDLDKLAKNLSLFEKHKLPKATTRALNKIGNSATTQVKREMSKEAGLAQNKVAPYIKTWRAAHNRPYFDINFRRSTFSLYNTYGATQNARGVTSKAWGKKKLYPGAFLAIMPNGKKDVFINVGGRRGSLREVKSGKNIGKKYRPELPLKLLYGPSLYAMRAKLGLDKKVEVLVLERFPTEFQRAIRSLGRR